MKQARSNPAARFVSAKSASKEFGLPYTTLRDLAFKGLIPVLKLGRAWYFERKDIEAFLAKHKRGL